MRVNEAESYDITIFPDPEIDNMDGTPFYLSDIWWDLIRNPNSDWQEGILNIKWLGDTIEIRPLNNTYITDENGNDLSTVEMDFEGKPYDWVEGDE